jgi:serine/threonine protein kinase
MGYVHRDLKPDNVVLTLVPLKIAIIDFERVCLDSDSGRDTIMGTPGYFPAEGLIRDGSFTWDKWAFAVMVLEADMPVGVYKQVNNQFEARDAARKHMNKKDTCRKLV